ncbi:MAG: tRNA (adenosine(37)-N6)-threonylcarbamoyltransferase complex dimerization subunit type 1 TsaB, partial [Hyphomicrobiales bacterium]|nr:tRNA (adenosine(37)-N6)-threonylcarbamoyltransferase complex dimerization subunit type 1 TsaB [Hyphomicrobiales bacterium]
MIVLALDTALTACSVCLFDTQRDKVIASESAMLGKGHAEALLPMLERVIAKLEGGWSAIGRIGVVVGPGSYTGLRVGIMSAKAFAYATGCALVAVDTFAAIALQAPESVERLDVLADAQQGKVYAQTFARSSPRERPT